MKMQKIRRSRRKWLWKKRRKLQAKLWQMAPWGSEKKTIIENEIFEITEILNRGFEVIA